MIWIIAKREFLEYLKSLRFMIGFLTTFSLVVLGAFINANDFTRRNQEYIAAREELHGNVYRVVVHRPPEVLSTPVQGMDRKLGSQAELSPMSIPALTSGYMGAIASQHSRLAAGFSTVDFAFVVRIILSLLVSSLLQQPSVVLLTLLAAWIFFAIVIPNAAGVVSEQLTRVPSEYYIARELEPMMQKQVIAGIDRIRERASAGELHTVEEVRREADGVFTQGQQSLIDHYQGYARAMRERSAFSRTLARLSPSALFQYAAETVAGTGSPHEERFLQDIASYSREYDRYVTKKVGALVSASAWSFGANIYLGEQSIYLRSPVPQEFQGDMSDYPRFTESRPTATEAAGAALMDCTGLILWNIALAALALRAITRCDVR